MKRSLTFISIYILWNTIFKTLVLTLLTYFMSRSHVPFREISDTFAGNQIAVYGLSTGIFLLFLLQMNSLTTVSRPEIINSNSFKNDFLPSYLKGSLFSLFLIFPLIIIGSHSFVGFLIQSDDLFSSLSTLAFRFLTLLILVYGEEFIFRYQWFQMSELTQRSPFIMILLGALLFTLTKMIQFHLGWSQLLTMMLIGLYFGFRNYKDLNFMNSAGLWSGFLLFAHIILSFPLFGNESQGLLFFQYNPSREWNTTLTRMITGGVGGPLSSLALQFLLLFGIFYELSKNYKILFGSSLKRLR